MLLNSKDLELIARKLADNEPNLTELDLGYRGVDDLIVEVLAEALKKNSTLTSLSLRNNLINDKGAGILAEILEDNNNLLILDLGSNQITDIGFKSLAEALKNNKVLTSLDLKANENDNRNNGIVNDLVEAFKVNFSLVKFEIYCPKMFKDKFDEFLAINQKIKDFFLDPQSSELVIYPAFLLKCCIDFSKIPDLDWSRQLSSDFERKGYLIIPTLRLIKESLVKIDILHEKKNFPEEILDLILNYLSPMPQKSRAEYLVDDKATSISKKYQISKIFPDEVKWLARLLKEQDKPSEKFAKIVEIAKSNQQELTSGDSLQRISLASVEISASSSLLPGLNPLPISFTRLVTNKNPSLKIV